MHYLGRCHCSFYIFVLKIADLHVETTLANTFDLCRKDQKVETYPFPYLPEIKRVQVFSLYIISYCLITISLIKLFSLAMNWYKTLLHSKYSCEEPTIVNTGLFSFHVFCFFPSSHVAWNTLSLSLSDFPVYWVPCFLLSHPSSILTISSKITIANGPY